MIICFTKFSNKFEITPEKWGIIVRSVYKMYVIQHDIEYCKNKLKKKKLKITRLTIIFSSIEKFKCTYRFIILFLFGLLQVTFNNISFMYCIMVISFIGWKKIIFPLKFYHNIVSCTLHHGLESVSHHKSLMSNSVT